MSSVARQQVLVYGPSGGGFLGGVRTGLIVVVPPFAHLRDQCICTDELLSVRALANASGRPDLPAERFRIEKSIVHILIAIVPS